MAPRKIKVNKFDYNNLSANDVICPICRSILTRPISLPCSHAFCSTCFDITAENSSIVCPVCGVRVGSWLRSASKSKNVINEVFWRAIQEQFSVQVKKKLKDDLQLTAGHKLKLKESNAVSVNKVSKVNSMEIVKKSNDITIRKNDTKQILLNNFATKPYSYKILYQKPVLAPSRKIFKESQICVHSKNDLFQNSTTKDRSNSIESECLYFKPIDHRNNPPSEGLTPIKVPTKKPSISSNVKILAPSGQNQIITNNKESAFARLSAPLLKEENISFKKENIDFKVEEEENNSQVFFKRKRARTLNKMRKKVKICHKGNVNKVERSAQKVEPNIKDSRKEVVNNSSKIQVTTREAMRNLMERDRLVAAQIEADYELAKTLQQAFNQLSQYFTRSAAVKRVPSKKQMKLEGIITPYKVK